MSPDLVNGLFEVSGSVFLWLNCWRLWKDKMVRGYSSLTTLFFSSWGFWNLYYYPHLEQWWSFAGGVSIVTANTVWLAMMLYYRKN
jgi:uncharacterized membrane protein YfcA